MAVAHTTTCQNYCSLHRKKCKETGFFNLMILKGTKFQIKVWKYLLKIPKGKVKTYKQVAIGIIDLNQLALSLMHVRVTLLLQKFPVIE